MFVTPLYFLGGFCFFFSFEDKLKVNSMKKVEAIIRKSKFSGVKKALHEVGVNFFSYWDVTGLGNEKEGHVIEVFLTARVTFKDVTCLLW